MALDADEVENDPFADDEEFEDDPLGNTQFLNNVYAEVEDRPSANGVRDLFCCNLFLTVYRSRSIVPLSQPAEKALSRTTSGMPLPRGRMVASLLVTARPVRHVHVTLPVHRRRYPLPSTDPAAGPPRLRNVTSLLVH